MTQPTEEEIQKEMEVVEREANIPDSIEKPFYRVVRLAAIAHLERDALTETAEELTQTDWKLHDEIKQLESDLASLKTQAREAMENIIAKCDSGSYTDYQALTNIKELAQSFLKEST